MQLDTTCAPSCGYHAVSSRNSMAISTGIELIMVTSQMATKIECRDTLIIGLAVNLQSLWNRGFYEVWCLLPKISWKFKNILYIIQNKSTFFTFLSLSYEYVNYKICKPRKKFEKFSEFSLSMLLTDSYLCPHYISILSLLIN